MHPNRSQQNYPLSKTGRNYRLRPRNYSSEILPDVSEYAKQLEDEEKSFETLLKVAIDVSILLILCVVINVLFYRFMPIVRNGFFCNDTAIRLPFKQATFPWWPTILASLGAAILFTVIVELCHYNGMKSPHRLGKWQIPGIVAHTYKYVGLFLFGCGIDCLIVIVLQKTVGRLGPNFYDVCEPVSSRGINCTSPEFILTYVSDFSCTNRKFAQDIITRGRQSFPSGLVALVAYAATYVIFVLQYRWAFEFGCILKPMLQASLAVSLIYIASAQVTDNLHHWTDVAAGIAIGVSLASFMFFIAEDVYPLRKIMV